MREILFRGKSIYSLNGRKVGTWVYGYFVYCASRYDDPEKDRVPEIIEIGADRVYSGEYNDWDVHEIDPDTVSQWTGLVDKNGVKIFEGDIVEADWGYCGVVELDSIMHAKVECRISEDIEVVGNKWDNPEITERREEM